MTDAKILQSPTPTTRTAGTLRAASNGPFALAPAPWRLEVWPVEDGYPERIWIRVDDELSPSSALKLAEQLRAHAARVADA